MRPFDQVRDHLMRRFGSYLDRVCARCQHKLGDHFPVGEQACSCSCPGFVERR